MAEIIPFQSVRPPKDKVHLVASRSYVTYKPKALKRKLKENPFSFIHIINPEFGKRVKSEPNSPERFLKVKERYEEFIEDNFLLKDAKPAFYLYKQVTPRRSFMGIICGVQVQEYLDGKIKIHEETLTQRVEVFTEYLDTCDFNAEPVLLTYKEKGHINLPDLAEKYCQNPAEYDFTTTDRIRHEMWIIDQKGDIEEIQNRFANIENLYIADGHHRMASSAKLGENRRARNNWSPTDICNYALALIIPDSILEIESFHRLINLGEPLDEADLINKLSSHFDVEKSEKSICPEKRFEFGMRLPSGWYSLKLKSSDISFKTVVGQLDPMLLTKHVLEPIFGILDQKTDPRIQFVPGIQSPRKLEKKVDKGEVSAIFTLHPVSTDELFAVADANEIMPPKSTYIEPKLRSGLTIMPLS